MANDIAIFEGPQQEASRKIENKARVCVCVWWKEEAAVKAGVFRSSTPGS